jgi:hypothetical protein
VRDLGDGVRDVADPPSVVAAPIAASRARCRVDEGEVFVARRPDDERDGRVGDPAVDGDGEVQRHEVAVAQRVVVRQTVQDGVVDRRADHLSERARAERRVVVDVARLGAGPPDQVVRTAIDGQQIGADLRLVPQRRQSLCDESPRGTHRLDLGGSAQLDHRDPFVRIHSV